jgi:hypothetical protein
MSEINELKDLILQAINTAGINNIKSVEVNYDAYYRSVDNSPADYKPPFPSIIVRTIHDDTTEDATG